MSGKPTNSRIPTMGGKNEPSKKIVAAPRQAAIPRPTTTTNNNKGKGVAKPDTNAGLSNLQEDYFDKMRLEKKEEATTNQKKKKKDGDDNSDSSWSVVSTSPPVNISSPYSASDILYPHESWVTFKHKAKALAEEYFGGKGKKTIKVRPIHGGSYNRVVNIFIDGKSRYILRIPRAPAKSDIEGEVAPLVFLQRHTQINSPKVTDYDILYQNAIESPYMIQERLPGICLYPAWAKSITDAQRLRVAQDLGLVFKQILYTRSSKPGRISFQRGKGGLNAQVYVVPFRPQYEGPWHFHSVEGAQPWDSKSSAATQPVADFMTSLIRSRLTNAVKCWPKNKNTHEILSRLLKVIGQIEKRGSLKNVQYSLYHWDIAARNIIFDPEAEKGKSSLGVIDWDDCVFAPSFMLCDPPTWVWKPHLVQSISDMSMTGSENSSASAEDEKVAAKLKKVFTDAAGPEYKKYSEDPVYEIARKITEYGMKGTRNGTDEDGKEAEQLVTLWQDYVKKK